MAPAWSPRRDKQPCSLAVPTSTIPAPGRQQSLALPGFPGHSGAQRHRKAQGDGSKPTGLGQPNLQRSTSAPLGVQVPLKSGPQHCKSGAEWGGEPRHEVCRLLPFHVQFPAGPGTACSECREIFLTAHRGHGWQPCSILSSTTLCTTALHLSLPCFSPGCSHLLPVPGLLQLRHGQRNTTNRDGELRVDKGHKKPSTEEHLGQAEVL